jgi:hypothetical protein
MQKIPQAVAYVLLVSALAATAQDAKTTVKAAGAKQIRTSVRARTEIGNLLHEFLSKVDDPAMHERFWADDLVYVGASGAKRTKQEIVNSVREGAKQPSTGPKETYDADDIEVRQYGDVAVLNFRLIRHAGDKTEYYRNSGTFVKNGSGQWQAVSWQATKAENH